MYNGDITKHGDHDDDVTSIVIVGVGIILMIVMWFAHKYSKEDTQIRWAKLYIENNYKTVHLDAAS